MIRTVRETGSTNADLAADLAAGRYVAEGDWLVADRQVAGRGRLGRDWLGGEGNFAGSTVVRSRPGDPEPGTLALLAGLAVHQAVAGYLPDAAGPLLKWPNDVMVGKAKLAGILLERIGDAVVVGIGVNLAAAPPVEGRQTVSLAAFGPAPDRDAFAAELARLFDIELDRWRTFGLSPLLRRWEAAAHPAGTPLVASVPEGAVEGTFAGLADDGALQLRLPEGTTRTVHAGEVQFPAA